MFHLKSPVGLRTVLWPWPPSLLFHESLLLVCESTWKVLPLMSDVVPVLAASVWSSCKGFSFLGSWIFEGIGRSQMEESDGGQVVFRGRSIKNNRSAPTSSKSSCFILFLFLFWKSSVCNFSLMPAVCTRLLSFHCVHQHVWHYWEWYDPWCV